VVGSYDYLKEMTVEVKIGFVDSSRELAINSDQTPAQVEKLVGEALKTGVGVLEIGDEKGRKYLVRASSISYIEIGVPDVRRVGFSV
jgi:hypothetical protein